MGTSRDAGDIPRVIGRSLRLYVMYPITTFGLCMMIVSCMSQDK